MSVTVLGSANVDLLLPVVSFPAAGETVLASGRTAGPGGKGLNQAVASARSGTHTTFVGAFGRDTEGRLLRDVLDGESVRAVVRAVDTPTGLAVVMVDSAGENSIVVSPGANAELQELSEAELGAVRSAQVLLAQLEVPVATVAAAARAARAAGVLVVLNAAPAAELDDDLLSCVDVLLVNEGEARVLAQRGGRSPLDEVVAVLLRLVPDVVVTLGAEGAVHHGRDGTTHRQPALRVRVVDTTAAGDTFAGYLAASLAAGEPVQEAMRRATAASALCVQRAGAVSSVPTRAEVLALLAAGEAADRTAL